MVWKETKFDENLNKLNVIQMKFHQDAVVARDAIINRTVLFSTGKVDIIIFPALSFINKK